MTEANDDTGPKHLPALTRIFETAKVFLAGTKEQAEDRTALLVALIRVCAAHDLPCGYFVDEDGEAVVAWLTVPGVREPVAFRLTRRQAEGSLPVNLPEGRPDTPPRTTHRARLAVASGEWEKLA